MSPELIAILPVGIGLCALIYQTSRSLRLDVRNDISQLRLEMDQLRQEVKDEINQLRQEMDQFRQEVKDEINQFRQELDQFRQEIRIDLGHNTERVARIEGMLTPKPWSGQDPTSPKTQTG
ncbi:MAG: hypothetical protein OXC84_01880 [Gammaproteobacteria bacterium]|nr:hypothetical protein [Gammaproteobacteria bacterium]